ncbi:lipoprotein [Salmonella enterica subsp. enterica serovar Typhimurium]|nr:lipoprotein [Salmonella enterica]VFS43143.1 lipoprotein [Salmonella enterica subsp. enterica serovar Typhimurium]
MKNVFKTLAVLLTLFSLTGCGLKGPLYFPPADKNAPPPTKKVDSQTQSTMPDKNDRATGDGRPRSITEDSFLSPRERSE